MMDKSTNLEIYKLMNERVQSEINEMYDVHKLHMISVTALITVSGFANDNSWLNLVCGAASIVICFIWWTAAQAQEKWKLWWTEQLALVEHELHDVCIWKKLIFNESADNTNLIERLEKPATVVDPPPDMHSVDSLLRYRPLVFGLISIVILFYGLYGVVTG